MLDDRKVPGYLRHVEGAAAVDPERPNIIRPGHSLENIQLALHDVAPPPQAAAPPGVTGFDVFVSYLILDAVIANRDRHEQNWAVLSPLQRTGLLRLAPSYDHAGSLGYNLTDQGRERQEQRLDAWLRRGTAHRFEHVRHSPPSLVDLAAQGVRMSGSAGRRWLATVLEADLEPVLEDLRARQVPDMSEAASRFACEVVTRNMGRLRDVIGP